MNGTASRAGFILNHDGCRHESYGDDFLGVLHPRIISDARRQNPFLSGRLAHALPTYLAGQLGQEHSATLRYATGCHRRASGSDIYGK